MTVVVTHTTPADSTFSSTGAAAWNANHALSGVGTMAEQDANSVAITGGTINGTTIGATTPAAGTFTTLTATGQTSLGGVAGAEGLRVVTTASAVNFAQVSGAVSGGSPYIGSVGGGTNINMDVFAKGTGSIRLNTGTNSVVQALITHTASAVNYVQVTGAATTAIPTISAQGSDANPSLGFTTKGTGSLVFFTNSSAQRQFRVSHTASAVNYLDATGSATGSAPVLSVVGNDTNIDLNLTTKGTGVINLNTGSGAQARIIDIGDGTRPLQINGGSAAGAQIPGITATAVLAISGGGGNPIRFYTNGRVTTQQMEVSHTASAVNYVQVTGSATSAGAGALSGVYFNGSDSNINGAIVSKGTGYIAFAGGFSSSAQAFRVLTSNAVSTGNLIAVQGAASGSSPSIQAISGSSGTDANIDIIFTPKGTGNVRFGTYTGTILTPTGYVEIKDSGGTVRRLLVG